MPCAQLIASTFANNTVRQGSGGAVSFDGEAADLVLVNNTFTGNSASDCGGGTYVVTGAEIFLDGDTYVGNTAASGGGLCYPVKQKLALCGDPANTLSGDVGPVKVGQLLPLKMNCEWQLPPEGAGRQPDTQPPPCPASVLESVGTSCDPAAGLTPLLFPPLPRGCPQAMSTRPTAPSRSTSLLFTWSRLCTQAFLALLPPCLVVFQLFVVAPL